MRLKRVQNRGDWVQRNSPTSTARRLHLWLFTSKSELLPQTILGCNRQRHVVPKLLSTSAPFVAIRLMASKVQGKKVLCVALDGNGEFRKQFSGTSDLQIPRNPGA